MISSVGEQNYAQWCNEMERRYDVMPLWYWNIQKRKAAFKKTLEQTREIKELQNGKTDV